MTCDYCDAKIRLDSRGRCKNCGAAMSAHEDPVDLRGLSAGTLAEFQSFVASTQQNIYGQRRYMAAMYQTRSGIAQQMSALLNMPL